VYGGQDDFDGSEAVRKVSAQRVRWEKRYLEASELAFVGFD